MPESNLALALSADQLEQLEQWLAAHGTPQQVALRCRIVLAAVQGGSDLSIAAGLDVNRHTVTLWRKRFAEQGLECLWQIAAGRGRKPIFGTEQIKAVVNATLQTKPKGMTHWSCRLMAKRQGMSKSTISNIWCSHKSAPSGQNLQTVARPEVCGKTHRRHRTVSEPARARAGAVRG